VADFLRLYLVFCQDFLQQDSPAVKTAVKLNSSFLLLDALISSRRGLQFHKYFFICLKRQKVSNVFFNLNYIRVWTGKVNC